MANHLKNEHSPYLQQHADNPVDWYPWGEEAFEKARKEVEPKKLKRLEASAKRLSVMYSSLTYRLEGKVEPSELLCFATVVKERVEYVKELIDSKRLHITLDLEPTEILMPKTSSYRLIDNLLSNAIKYSDVGDSIFITLKDNVLKVKDTGIGR